LRGPTYVAVVADELAFWYVDAAYANPDVEILNAVEPGLATTCGPLILASSPHARRGVLWEAIRLVSVAKLVDFERGQVSYADFIGITVLSRG
jgi:hypothetical protein